MRTLDKKLWRQVWGMRLQALAIALVLAGGMSIFVMALTTLDSLYRTQQNYYAEYRFAHVFADLKRAPEQVAEQVRRIPGVKQVQTQVMAYSRLYIPGFNDPVSGHIVSLSATRGEILNRIVLEEGSLPDPFSGNDVLLSKEFAEAHNLHPGQTIGAIINGHLETLSITGLACSPEYIYQVAPGAMLPDYKRYGILWMGREALANAYAMDGAFNKISLLTEAHADTEEIITRLDAMLKPYGGSGAIERRNQLSHRMLSEELRGLKTTATIFPVIFFGVAAFLTQVVAARTVALERRQIAILKAFGYHNRTIGLHYIKLVLLIASPGAFLGTATGIWMGRAMSHMYMRFYSLPFLSFYAKPGIIVAALAIGITICVSAALHAVHNAVALSAAEGMLPPAPPSYRPSYSERLGLARLLTQPQRMILRSIERRPGKSLLTIAGIAMACSIMVVSGFQKSAIDHMVKIQYGMSQWEDLSLSYTEPAAAASLESLRALPGVMQVEGLRHVAVRLRHQHYQERTSIQGLGADMHLKHLLDVKLRTIHLPQQGLVLSEYLAQLLHVQPGDILRVEVLEQKRQTLLLPVARITRQYMGLGAYMHLDALNRALDDSDIVSGALLQIDPALSEDIYARLKEIPRIAGITEHGSSIKAFYDSMAGSILFFTAVATLLGALIVLGVVYNNMSIALSEQKQELASLRILGFSRGETAALLFGEQALLSAIAIPVGLGLGHLLCLYLARFFATELYRIPVVADPAVYARAAAAILVAWLLSAWILWQRLSHMDISVALKSRE